MRCVSLVRLLPPHIAGSNLCRVAYPQLVAEFGQQVHQPMTVSSCFHANQRWRRHLLEPFRIAAGSHQLLLASFSGLRVQPTHLLPAGMKITPYNHHCEGSFLPRSLSPQTKTTGSIEPSLLSNQSFSRTLRKGWVMGIIPAP